MADQPQAYVMAGIPAAGKSTYVNARMAEGTFPSDAFILDPDRVMQTLPDYQAMYDAEGAKKAFQFFETIARDKAYALFEDALFQRQHIIKDMGCTRDENIMMVSRMRDAGYHIDITVLQCPVTIAAERIKKRPRFTPTAMLIERERGLADRIDQLQALAHEFRIIVSG